MRRYTAESLDSTWGEKEAVEARAKRGKWSTGPTEEETEAYKEFFKKAAGDKKNIKALVLGATPELRDLAISLGADTLAVDLSQNLLDALSHAMKHKNSDKNRCVNGDWLKMHEFLEPGSFDIVLADCSLNNVPAEDNETLIKITAALLNKDGYFITRNVACIDRKEKPVKEFTEEYNQGRNTPMGLFIEMGLYSIFARKAYDKNKCEIFWSRVTEEMMDTLKNELSKKDMDYIENLRKHADTHSTIVLPKKRFEHLLKSHFHMEAIKSLEGQVYTESIPIYFLRKKQ